MAVLGGMAANSARRGADQDRRAASLGLAEPEPADRCRKSRRVEAAVRRQDDQRLAQLQEVGYLGGLAGDRRGPLPRRTNRQATSSPPSSTTTSCWNWTYKVPAHANSGIMYRVSEDEARAPFTGIEYQILDNTDPNGGRAESRLGLRALSTTVGSQDRKAAGRHPARRPVEPRQVGVRRPARAALDERRRILPGTRSVATIGTSASRKVKYAKWPRFAKNARGHIALQGDHGDACFANIKLLALPAK